MNKKFYNLILVLIFFLLINFGGLVQAENLIWAPPDLELITKDAIVTNKEIKSMKSMLESLNEKIPVAGALPDPMLGVAVLNLPTNSFKFDEQPMTQKQISISQKLPWFGKLDLKTENAKIAAMKFEALLHAKKLNLSQKIASLYYDLGIIKSSQETNLKLVDMVNQISQIAETRYSTGRGVQQDIFQAQVELSKLLDEKISLDKMYHVKELKLIELIGQSLFSQITPPSAPKEPTFTLNADELKKTAMLWNPQLKVMQLEVNASKINVDIAQKDYWPDVDVKFAYGQRDEDMSGKSLDDFFSASLNIPIPVWQHTKQNKNRSSAEKGQRSAESAYENLVDILPLKIDALVTEIEDLKKNYRLYRDILIVQGGQWAKSALSGYEVGKIEFNTMINARIRLLHFELQAEKYLYTIYQKRAELEEIIGKPIELTIKDTGKDNINE